MPQQAASAQHALDTAPGAAKAAEALISKIAPATYFFILISIELN